MLLNFRALTFCLDMQHDPAQRSSAVARLCADSGSSENLESLAAGDNRAFDRRSQDGSRSSIGGLGSRGSSMEGLPSLAG